MMFDNKDSNPKTGASSPKPAMEFVPPVALLHLAEAHRHGAAKYGAFNWRELGVSETTYYSAIHRHLAAWFDGQDTDPESRAHHLGHVMACCAILLDAGTLGKLNRDRPPLGKAADEITLMSILRQQNLHDRMGASSRDFTTSIYANVHGTPTPQGASRPGQTVDPDSVPGPNYKTALVVERVATPDTRVYEDALSAFKESVLTISRGSYYAALLLDRVDEGMFVSAKWGTWGRGDFYFSTVDGMDPEHREELCERIRAGKSCSVSIARSGGQDHLLVRM